MMRKIALLVICLSVLVALAGCGQSRISAETKPEETETAGQAGMTDAGETGDTETVVTPAPDETEPQTEDVQETEQPEPVREEVCELYLEVLEDLWKNDPGLNGGISRIGVDLSGLTHLTEAEREYVMGAFASKRDLPYVSGTWDELCDQGYIDRENLFWEDGLFFSITTVEDTEWNLPYYGEGDIEPELTAFNANKWRSGLGAIFFEQCTARKNDDGTWSYTLGGFAIS